MTCRRLIAFLDGYLDGVLEPDVRQAFDAHLADCRACRDYVRTYQDTITMTGSAVGDGDAVDFGAPPELVRAILLAAREPDYHP